MEKYAFGVDVGGTTIKIGYFDTEGTMISRWEIPTNTQNNGSEILKDIANEIEKKIQQEQISKEDVRGIGIGVPGPVKSNGVVNRCINLGWGEKNVEEELHSLTNLYVKAGNDANVAALGEMWQGGAKGCKDVIMVTLGTGVGGGVIIDGKLVYGYAGAGGEIGHMAVCEEETEQCNCGKCGCLEQYVSATGIVRLAKRAMQGGKKPEDILPDGANGGRATDPSYETSLKKFENLTAKDVYDEAKGQDPLAIAVTELAGQILGKAIANTACVVNPEVIVIGGGVSKAGEFLLEPLKRYYSQYAFHACKDVKFALATLGNDAGMYGCVKLLL